MSSTIYTHDEAMLIVEMFEDILSEYNIHIPSPEDDEREPDNMVGLYGYTYSDVTRWENHRRRILWDNINY